MFASVRQSSGVCAAENQNALHHLHYLAAVPILLKQAVVRNKCQAYCLGGTTVMVAADGNENIQARWKKTQYAGKCVVECSSTLGVLVLPPGYWLNGHRSRGTSMEQLESS